MTSLTKEQKKELNLLDQKYDQVNLISINAGMNPDKLINEFSYKFMDASELNRLQTDEINEGRNNVFRTNLHNKSL